MYLFKQIAANSISLEAFDFFSELNIEAFIIENSDVLSNEEDFKNPTIIHQQLHLRGGTPKGDGRIDLLAKTENELLIIIEVKNGTLNEKNLTQLKNYLKAFPLEKMKILSKIDNGEEYKDYEIKGLLVGKDISNGLKEKLQNNKESNVIGLTLKRYKSSDEKECFITTEFFQPAGGPKRFKDWSEFKKAQNKKGIADQVIELGKLIHDDFNERSNTNYTPAAFTLNVKKDKRRKLFAYVILKKNCLQIYLLCNGSFPDIKIATPNPNQVKYKNEYSIKISTKNEYNERKKLINDSFEIINNS